MSLCCELNTAGAFRTQRFNFLILMLGLAVSAASAANLLNVSPPSGLLPPGSSTITLQFDSAQADTCRYSVGNAAPQFSAMSTLESAPVVTHISQISGLSTDPRTLNHVNIACASNPTDITTLIYRSVTAPNGSFPRIGSIWIGNYLYNSNLPNAKKIQLFLGADFSPAQATTLRAANANVIILPSTNVVEARGYPNGVVYGSITLPNGTVTAPITVPDASYYLRDVHGNPISDWPGSYLLNLTNPAVAQFLAHAAYQVLVNSNFAYDGIFFDNFFTSISWFTTDVNGNPVQISSANNGVADDPATLDAAWSAGVYQELAQFRNLAPGAYTSGHLGSEAPPNAMLSLYNGNSLVFDAVNVREGTMPFNSLWNLYQTWTAQSQTPPLTMVQSSPPNQIAYGYSYAPIPYSGSPVLPTATATFAQTFYPNMRFGLATALMGSGFFSHDFGDTGAPVNWWYDEYDFNLGTPLSAARNISGITPVAQLTNGGFENSLTGWNFSVNHSGGDTAAASSFSDTTTSAEGSRSAHVAVTSPTTISWHIGLSQAHVSLTAGTTYQLAFWAKANAVRTIAVELQAGAPGYANYYSTQVNLDTSWQQFTVSFVAGTTDPATTLEFFLGGPVGDIWLDGVQFATVPPPIYRRDFTNGSVLLNGTNSAQTISVEAGFQKFTGAQAPLYQYIIDDTDAAFSSTGTWNSVTIDTGYGRIGAGETPTGPYYHAWNASAQTNSGTGTAQWSLKIPADGAYTVQAWLPAAPAASSWSKSAVYEVVSGSTVLASATIDQTSASAGDQWHTIATVALTAASSPFIRLHGADGNTLLADAIYVTSAARFNDGSNVGSITLQPMDGILLQKQTVASQTISFPPIATQAMGTSLALSATATSGLTVTFTSTTTGVCTVSGNTASLIASGSCTISASQNGNGSYVPAAPVSQTFTVLASQTITFNAIAAQTVGTSLSLTASASSGLPGTFTSSTPNVCTMSTLTASLITPGTCNITASQNGNGIYAAAPSISQSFTVNGINGPTALQFVPITPCRIADTRGANGPFGGPILAPASKRDFVIPNSNCGVPSNAAAYSLNVTAVPTGGLGFLALWPSGLALPAVSTLNSDSRVKANAAIVPAGTGGSVAVYVSDQSHVILDINGYFIAGNSTALDFYPLAPCRIADTRLAAGPLGGPFLTGGVTRAFPVLSSACDIPATAQAYSLNFTAIPHAWLGFLSTWPTGQSQPTVSTLNSPGSVTANAAIVPAGTNGAVNVYASNDSDVIIDVNGYFAPPTTGGLALYNVTPCRALDTRSVSGAFNGTINQSISPSSCTTVTTAQAFVLNATAVPPGPLWYLTLWPAGQTQPTVSTLNAPDAAITSNMAIVPATNGSISVYGTNPTQLILDISAYFAP